MLSDVYHIIVRPLLFIKLSTYFPFSRLRQSARDGCDRSAEETLSFLAPDPTSNFCRYPCYSAPDLYFSFKFSCLNTIFQNHYSFLMTCSLYYLVTIYCFFSLDRALNVNTSFDLKVTDSLGNDLVRVHFT